jgi:hypothetical protein
MLKGKASEEYFAKWDAMKASKATTNYNFIFFLVS